MGERGRERDCLIAGLIAENDRSSPFKHCSRAGFYGKLEFFEFEEKKNMVGKENKCYSVV